MTASDKSRAAARHQAAGLGQDTLLILCGPLPRHAAGRPAAFTFL